MPSSSGSQRRKTDAPQILRSLLIPIAHAGQAPQITVLSTRRGAESGSQEARKEEETDVRSSQHPYVRPDVKAFLDFMASVPGPSMAELGPEGARASYVQMGLLAEAEPRELAVIKDLTCPGPAGDIPLRFYDARETREPGPAVMFFHGGGFVIGDLDSHHSLCTEIAAELDLPVIAVHYRLAPEHPSLPHRMIAKPHRGGWRRAPRRWAARSPASFRWAIRRVATLPS